MKRPLLLLAPAVLLLSLFAPRVYRAFIYARIYPQQPYLPNVAPLQPLGLLDAESCGQCHRDIYQEWSASLHRRAWTDPLFQADLRDLGAPYLCAYCHAPLGQQRPTIVSGLSSVTPLRALEAPNPQYLPSLRAEGVTCVACHLREGRLLGPRDISPDEAPHGVTAAPGLSSAETCAPCHSLPESFGASLERPIIDTYHEWQEYQRLGGTESCTGCHMPAVTRASVPNGKVREGRRHTFLGHEDAAFVESALEVRDLKASPRGDALSVEFTLENKTGHRFPTGEPGRYLELSIEARGLSDEVLSQSPVARIQRVVNEHGFTEISDNTLSPREQRRLSAAVRAPEGATLWLIATYYVWDPDSAVGRASGMTRAQLTRVVFRDKLSR